jgi:hypothetical protein
LTKDIDTLVTDIQELFNAPHKCNPDRVREFGRGLAETVEKRLGEERSDSYLRMSNLGRGDRQLYYDLKTDLAKEVLTPSTKIKFLFGDILELMLLFLSEEAGHEVTHKQEKVEYNGIVGSCDAVIDGVLVDCKSASSYSYLKFKNGTLAENDAFGYMEQLSGYSASLGHLDGAFLAIDKQLGHICLDYHPKEELASYRIGDRIDHLKEVLANDVLPDRCYLDKKEGVSGNRVLDTNCSYCPFKFTCWQDSNGGVGLRTFIYSNGPKHFTHVEKEPRVMEVTF